MILVHLQQQKNVLQMVRTVWAADGIRGLLWFIDSLYCNLDFRIEGFSTE